MGNCGCCGKADQNEVTTEKNLRKGNDKVSKEG
jgi:hypothetical protein